MHNSPFNIKFILDISLDAYGCSYDNTFILFKSSQNLIHLIYSNLKKSIISYNLSNSNKFQILTEIKNAHDKGYKVNLYYYWLESAEASYRRVLQRVEEGKDDVSVDNHMIPEDVIRRRFPRSINNLLHLFIPIVEFWQVYDNNLGLALPIANTHEVTDPYMWDVIQRNNPDEAVSSVDIDRLVNTIGIRRFSETVLQDKLRRNESVIYSIEGKVVKFSPDDILWLYDNCLFGNKMK